MKTDLVVAGYIFDKNKVLLIHHKKLDLWLPVGGHIQKNETPDGALLREIKEEVGLEVEIINNNKFGMGGSVKKNLAIPFNINLHSAGDHDHCCFFYVCKAIDAGKLNVDYDELKDYEWFSKEELNQNYVSADVRAMALKGFEILDKVG